MSRHYGRVYAICRRLAGNDADAADATQEALLAIMRGLPNFDGRAKFSTWSYRVATNAALDELRRRGRRPVPIGHDQEAGSDEDHTAGSVSPHVWSDRRVGSHEEPAHDETTVQRLSLDAVLPQIPEDFRVAMVLRDVTGLDYAQIAEVLDIPPGTVRSRIARGRRIAAQLLGNQTL